LLRLQFLYIAHEFLEQLARFGPGLLFKLFNDRLLATQLGKVTW
jgi:hypothetical protein